LKVIGFQYVAVTSAGREVRNYLWVPAFFTETGATRLVSIMLRLAFAEVKSMQLEPALALRASTENVAIFTRRLAVMVAAGLPLHGAISFLSETEDGEMNIAAQKLASMLSSGHNLSNSLASMPGVFPPAFVGFARAGETSGKLVPALESFATQLERTVWMRRRVRSAMGYPFFLTVGAVLLSALLLFGIVPMMTPTLQQMNVELPALTVALLDFIHFISNPIAVILMILGTVTLVTSLTFVMSPTGRFTRARKWLDRWILSIPLAQRVVQHYASARILSAVGMSVDTGIPVTRALREASCLASNTVIEDRIIRTCEHIARGEPLEEALVSCAPFARGEVQVLICTSETGHLSMGMNRMAKQAEENLDNTISALTSLLEPMILACMSVVVGTVCIATFLPWINLLESIL
jgi:type IV pilus assembly protein PilC